MVYDPHDPATKEWDAFVETVFDTVGLAVAAHLLWLGMLMVEGFGDAPFGSLPLPAVWLGLVSVLVLAPGLWWCRRRLQARCERGAFSPALKVMLASVALVVGVLLTAAIPILLRGTAWAGVRDSGSWFFMCVGAALWTWWALRLCGSRTAQPGWPARRAASDAGEAAVAPRKRRRSR